MVLPEKSELKAELLRVLEAELELLMASQRAAQEGATHEESKAEDDKDTRAIEQSYLARGQAARVAELETGVQWVRAMELKRFAEDEPIAGGALVRVLEAGHERALFLAPDGGGTALGGGRVLVVTPRAPLGKALLGKSVGELFEIGAGSKRREIEIIGVS